MGELLGVTRPMVRVGPLAERALRGDMSRKGKPSRALLVDDGIPRLFKIQNKSDRLGVDLIAGGDKNLTKNAVGRASCPWPYQSTGSANSGLVSAARWWSRQAPSMKR